MKCHKQPYNQDVAFLVLARLSTLYVTIFSSVNNLQKIRLVSYLVPARHLGPRNRTVYLVGSVVVSINVTPGDTEFIQVGELVMSTRLYATVAPAPLLRSNRVTVDSERNKRTGFLGELFIDEMLRSSVGFNNYELMNFWGESYGQYDFRLWDSNLNRHLYVEVKATRRHPRGDHGFRFSYAERELADEKGEDYVIYRVWLSGEGDDGIEDSIYEEFFNPAYMLSTGQGLRERNAYDDPRDPPDMVYFTEDMASMVYFNT